MDEYILDACALIAYYTNEKGADVVQDIISKAYSFLHDIVNSHVRIIETIERQAFIEAGRLKANFAFY